MSNNYFSGSIPSSFGNLTLLTSLVLKNNGLSGQIPISFGSSLSSITTCEVAIGNSFCELDHQIFPSGCSSDLSNLPLCFPLSTNIPNPLTDSSTSSSLSAAIIAITIVFTILIIVLLILLMIFIARRRQSKLKLRDREYSKMSMLIGESMKSIDLLKTVTNDTIIKLGPTFAMPGHLLFDFQNDLRIIADLAEGGGGSIKLAEMLYNPLENVVHVDSQPKNVIVKLLKSSNESHDDSTVDLNLRAIWQQEISILW